MSKKHKRGSGQAGVYTSLDQHRRKGSELLSPLLGITGLKQVSWLDERLPDMLWCAVLITHFERETVLDLFREIAVIGRGRFVRGVDFSLSQTGLTRLPNDLAEQIVGTICEPPEARELLRALLLLDDLPARELWERAIGQEPYLTDWEVLAEAVAQTLDHQSVQATDCRWAAVLFKVLGGQHHLRSEDEVKALFLYPEAEDELGGFVRTTEGQENPLSPNTVRPVWVKSFWDQCLRDTPCEPIQLLKERPGPGPNTLISNLERVRAELVAHADASVSTTDVDARYDTVFGFGAYCLDLAGELLRNDVGSQILGRIGLRALLECHITLAYLAHRDDPEVWLAYRQYGSGQAKLAFLKADTDVIEPEFLDRRVLHMIANEDRWQEFLPINLGHWEKTNLRVMSEKTAVKDIYDRYYPWTSAFVHGNWAAVRNVEFDMCANPLHRLHRLLREAPAPLDHIARDACILADLVLSIVDQLYPTFSGRIAGEIGDMGSRNE